MSIRPVILGELGLISLFDLAQLLMLNGATGTLHVNADGKKGLLRFERGQIASALDEMLQDGESAAYRVFSWRSGTFEFRVEPPLGPRTIHDSTEGLMLEAARRMDEAGAVEAGGSVRESLQMRVGRIEALRAAFLRVTDDLVPVDRTERRASDGTRFGLLSAAGDALLYRPGHPLRLQHSGQWGAVSDDPLEGSAYARLCASLFEGVESAHEGVAAHRVLHEDGRVLEISRMPAPNESLLVRALEVGAGGAPELRGDEPTLSHMTTLASGLLLVGAPGIRAAEHLLQATLARMLTERALTSVITAERGAWDLPEALGALLVTRREGFAEAVATFAPDVLAFDVAHADLSLEAMHAAPIVVCAVVAPDAASLLPRWIARHGLTAESPNALPLAGGEIGVLYSSGATGPDGALRVTTAGSTTVAAGPLQSGLHAVSDGETSSASDAAISGVIARLKSELRDAA